MSPKLEDIGEREIIRRVREILGEAEEGIGLGDDTAAIPFGDSYLLVTTDLMAKKTHIPEAMTPLQIGWHIVAINLSDIAAMGGKPLGFLVALGLPREMEYEELEQCMQGMEKCCSEFGIDVLGGDTKESDEFTLAGTAIGTVPKDQILQRKGSQTGDHLCVTGPLGRAACGYHALRRGLELSDAVSSLLRPYPRVKEGMALSSSGTVSACMDISDGLASSIHQMTELGGSHFRIIYDDIPKPEEMTTFRDIPEESLVLFFGGDYELLFTVKKNRMGDAKDALERVDSQLWRIGEVMDINENIMVKGGKEHPLPNRGWEHLSPARLQ